MNRALKKFAEDGKFTIGKQDLPKQEWIDSGSYVLNYALGGGYPIGKMIEVYGPPSSGKSLLSLVAEANVTRQKKYVLHCDLEGNHTTQELNLWRESFGVDMDYVLQINQTYAEELIDNTVEILTKSGKDIPLMIVDSIGALTSEKTLSKKADEATVAVEAKLIARWTRQLLPVSQHTCILFLNHTMAKIGSYMGGTTTKGGESIKFFSGIRLEVKGKKIKDPRGELYGAVSHEITACTRKNKTAPPERTATMDFDYQTMTFDIATELLLLGQQIGMIESKPPMYSLEYNGEVLKFKGREAVKDAIRKDEGLREYLTRSIFGR